MAKSGLTRKQFLTLGALGVGAVGGGFLGCGGPERPATTGGTGGSGGTGTGGSGGSGTGGSGGTGTGGSGGSGGTGAGGRGGTGGTGTGGTGGTGTGGTGGSGGTGTGGTGGTGTGGSGGAGGRGGAGGGTGTGGSGGAGGRGGSGGGDAGAPDMGTSAGCSGSVTATISGNHGHTLMVPLADIMAGAQKCYNARGTAQHEHWITVTAADFTTLKAGGAVTKFSCNGGDHEYVLKCGGGGPTPAVPNCTPPNDMQGATMC